MSKSYSQLLRDIESGEIISIILIPNRREVIVELINGEKKVIPIFYNDQKILRISEEYNVPLTVRDIRSEQRLANYITGLGLTLIFVFSLVFVIRRSTKLLNNLQSFSGRSSQVNEDDIRNNNHDYMNICTNRYNVPRRETHACTRYHIKEKSNTMKTIFRKRTKTKQWDMSNRA